MKFTGTYYTQEHEEHRPTRRFRRRVPSLRYGMPYVAPQPYAPPMYARKRTNKLAIVDDKTINQLGSAAPWGATPTSDQQQYIVESLVASARRLFPEQTATAETWLQEQLARYGIMRAKETAYDVVTSPWPWLAGGLAVGWLITRKR